MDTTLSESVSQSPALHPLSNAELAARIEATPEWQYFRTHQINIDPLDNGAMRRLFSFRLRRVKFSADRRFRDDAAGISAGVVAAMSKIDPTDRSAGRSVDTFVAYPLHRPDKFAPEAGRSSYWGTIVGGDQLPDEKMEPSVKVWRTPLRWLQNNCKGIVIVEPPRSAIGRLRGVTLLAEDHDHAEELRAALVAAAYPAARAA